MNPLIPTQMEEKIPKIEKAIIIDLIKRIISSLLIIIYFSFPLYLIFFRREINLNFYFIWAGVIIFLLIVVISLRNRLKQKELFSLSLLKIVKGVEDKTPNKRYIYFLGRQIIYMKDKDIKKGNFLFESEFLKQNTFYKNLSEILQKINYAIINNTLNKINTNSLVELARDIYLGNKTIIKLSGEINQSLGSDKEKLPSFLDNFKRIFLNTKIGQFIFFEIILVTALWIIYNFFYKDMGVIMIGFFTLTSAIATIVFMKKPNE